MSPPAMERADRSVGLWARTNPLTRKLSHFARLSAADEQFLDGLTVSEEHFPPDVNIVVEGTSRRSVLLIKEGMAIRYRTLADGGRQILTFLIPGDLCDGHAFLINEMDHSIGTITHVSVAAISRDKMMDLFSHRPRISAAIWWSSLQEQAMLRERIVSLGRRDARGRVAYLLCELLWRHTAVGLADGKSFQLPLTQTELADTLGLTPVYVNLVLKDFRERKLVEIHQRMISLLKVAALQDIAGLNQDYLQLGGAPDEVTRYFDALEGDYAPFATCGPLR